MDDKQAVSLIQTWLDTAHASDTLPTRMGYAFSGDGFSRQSANSSEGEEDGRLGIEWLRELAVYYQRMRDEFESSAVFQRKSRKYLDLFHPFPFTILHGQWFRTLSIAEIAVVEWLFWRTVTEKQETPVITIVLAEGEFAKQHQRIMEQLHSFFDLPGPPVLQEIHEEIARSFFLVPVQSFASQLAGSSSLSMGGSILLSCADHHNPSDVQLVMDRIQALCETQTGFSSRVIHRVPSYGGPGTSTWLFARSEEQYLPRVLTPASLQTCIPLALAHPQEHERLVLARNGIENFFVRSFVLGSHRDDRHLWLWIRPRHTQKEWNNESIEQAFQRLRNAAATSSSVSTTSAPCFRGIQSNAPWTEVDEFRLKSATDSWTTATSSLSILTLLEKLKFRLADDAQLVILTQTWSESNRLRETFALYPVIPAQWITILTMEDPYVCTESHRHPETWLRQVSFVAVWKVSEHSSPFSFAEIQRLLFFLGTIQSKEFSGSLVFCNHSEWWLSILAEKEKRDLFLQQHVYIHRRLRWFSTICVENTTEQELLHYISQ